MTPAQTDRLERIASCLDVLGGPELGPPETDEALDALEAALGRALPPEVRAVYRLVGRDASPVISANLDMAPLLDGEAAVATHTEELRGWGWVIPQEVVVFAGDGGGRVYGLWLPEEGARRHPILLLDTGDDDGPDMGIVAQDLPAFTATELILTGGMWTAERDGRIQELLGLPDELRGDPDDRLPAGEVPADADSVVTDPILRWASPDVPEVAYDIYRGTTVADVHRIADRR